MLSGTWKHCGPTGLMRSLSDAIFSDVLANQQTLPYLGGAERLLIASDYSGNPSDSHQVYSFLVTGEELLGSWLQANVEVRKTHLRDGRRISFKRSNDKIRLRALPYFLGAATHIPGLVYQFAVSNQIDSLFYTEDATNERLLAPWKTPIRERVLRVAHFASFLIAGLSRAGQNVLWISDEDSILPDHRRSQDFASIFSNIVSHYSGHNLGHLRWATTASAASSDRHVEDLLSIPDLCAGVVSKYLNSYPAITYDGIGLEPRSTLLLAWLAVRHGVLAKRTSRIFPNAGGLLQSQTLRFHARAT